MFLPRVVHVSPLDLSDFRRAELLRIFGEEVEVVTISHLDHDPVSLVKAIEQAQPHAVLLGTASSAHRQSIQEWARDIPILRTKFKRVRNNRGEMENRPAGLGLQREAGWIEALEDGALMKQE